MKSTNQGDPLIVIVSHRGPFSFTARRDGGFKLTRGAGGLVTALGALAEQHEVLWVACALSPADRAWAKLHEARPEWVDGVQLRLISPNLQRHRLFYNVIANPLLWFIQHQLWDIPRAPSIDRDTWKAWEQGYTWINHLYAEVIAQTLAEVQRPIILLPQDYHLYLLPFYLREAMGERVHIQPFLHIPWPGPDAWRILPAQIRNSILIGLLSANRIGFQTEKDAFNFVQTCRFYLPDAHAKGTRDTITYRGRTIRSTAYPISIDVQKVEQLAEDGRTRQHKASFSEYLAGRQLILRVDRIEPSKNILRGLQAYRNLLESHPEHRGQVQMLALLVPSRLEVDEYQDYLRDIMGEAGLINAEFSTSAWEPVRIVVGDNYARALALMQLYDVLLVNPIADGMNLVAKEGVLVNLKNGVLVLSEHAGAFYELGDHALTVSPFDTYGTAEALHQALTMPEEERLARANKLHDIVKQADVNRWFYAQVEDALNDLRSQARKSSTPDTPGSKPSA